MSYCCASVEKIPLWSIKHANGHVYLLGSIHLLKEKLDNYREPIEKAFLESQILFVEAYIGSKNLLENAGKMMQAGSFTGDERLSTFFSEEQYSKLDALVKDMGFNLNVYDHFRPWLLALTLSSMALMRQGYNPMLGVDLSFINKAEVRQMEIEELEGVDYQIHLFQKMSREEEEAFLLSTIAEYKSQEKVVDKLVAAWKEGDLETLEDILTKSTKEERPELKDFYRSLLQSRNEKMAEKTEALLKEGKRCFIIVGVGHLIGESGLIELLRKKGHRVVLL